MRRARPRRWCCRAGRRRDRGRAGSRRSRRATPGRPGSGCTGDSSTACERLLGRHLDRDADHLGPRHHHVRGLLVGEVEHLVEHLALVLLDLAVRRRHLEQHLQLGLRVRLPLRQRGIDADRALRRIARSLQEPDQRLEDEEEGAHRNRDAERDPLGVAEREALRHELTDDDVHERDDQEREQDRDERAEVHAEQVRQHLLADRADRERCERDAELHRGDEMRRVAGDLHHRAGGAAPLVDELLQPRAAHGDERVLGRDEEAVQQDQNGDGEKLEENRHAPVSGAAVLEGSSSTTARQYRRRRRRPRRARCRAARPCRRARAARGARASRRRRTVVRPARGRLRTADTTPRSRSGARSRALQR